MNVVVDKQAIINSFSQQASVYENYANVQQRNAEQLAEFIQQDMRHLVAGPLLEIGCGTGIFTRQILKLFPQRELFISDISSAMLQYCAEHVGTGNHSENFRFIQVDAEALDLDVQFAVIVASFSLQWVSNFEQTLQNLLNQLLPGGQLIIAVPIDESFKEWREQCICSQVPYTANSLPNNLDFLKYARENELSIDWTLNNIECDFDSSLAFFKSLKGVGASVATNGQTITGAQLRKLTRDWDNAKCKTIADKITVTYSVLSARITKGASR